jgi:hypothetical protein
MLQRFKKRKLAEVRQDASRNPLHILGGSSLRRSMPLQDSEDGR